MFFSTNAKVFYKKDDEYMVKQVECIDIHDDSIFIMAEDNDEKSHKLVSVPIKSEPILKQLLINKVEIQVEDSDKVENGIYSGDILEISRGKMKNLYEAVMINGEIKGRELTTLMVVDLEKIINDEKFNTQLTNKHRDSNGFIVYFKR